MIDGGNIFRYCISPAVEYVDFRPENIKSGGDDRIYSKERIVVRQIGSYPEGALCPPKLLTLNTIYNIYLDNERFNIKYILAVINSKAIHFYWLKRFYDNKKTFPKIKKQPLESIPVRDIPAKEQAPIVRLVDEIHAAKRRDPKANTGRLEGEIDWMVYGLYGLTKDEVDIVEASIENQTVQSSRTLSSPAASL